MQATPPTTCCNCWSLGSNITFACAASAAVSIFSLRCCLRTKGRAAVTLLGPWLHSHLRGHPFTAESCTQQGTAGISPSKGAAVGCVAGTPTALPPTYLHSASGHPAPPSSPNARTSLRSGLGTQVAG